MAALVAQRTAPELDPSFARSMRTVSQSALLRRSTRSRRLDLADLPGLFLISPIAAIENGDIRLQKGKIASIENEKAEIEQFERSSPCMLARHGPHAPINNEGP